MFTYDFGGNILTKKGYAYTTGTVGAMQRSYTYVYGDANWKDKLTAINGVSITSDAIGNPLSDGTWTYKWAKGRQLQSMSKTGTSISYTYNEDGLRVGKKVNGTETSYVLHGKNVVHLTRGNDSLHFYYGADGHPTVVEYNGVSYGYTYNLQGDVISLQDADGWTQVQYAYDAWGKPIGKTGAMADTLGTLNPFRYRGYLYDEETGLYYLRSRYYNPSWGRFINADALLSITGSTLGLNIFAYCNNNPVLFSDSDGMRRKDLTLPNHNRHALALSGAEGGAGGGSILIGVGGFGLFKLLQTFCAAISNIISPKQTVVEKLNSSLKIKQELTDIAKGYGNLKCVEARDKMLEYLKKKRKHGDIVCIQYPSEPGFVYSISHDKCISLNGFHVGVEYEGVVFCNVHPTGLPLDEWLADFIAVGMRSVTIIPY